MAGDFQHNKPETEETATVPPVTVTAEPASSETPATPTSNVTSPASETSINIGDVTDGSPVESTESVHPSAAVTASENEDSSRRRQPHRCPKIISSARW